MIAVDTNILVYAVDANEPIKGPKAIELLRGLQSQQTVLLWQVVCEFGAAITRRRIAAEPPRGTPAVVSAWLDIFPLAVPSRAIVEIAWRLMSTHQLSYWDSMLLAACIDAGVSHLYTEDLQGRPNIEGVQLINPFA